MICKYCAACADLRRVNREMDKEVVPEVASTLNGLIQYFEPMCKGGNWCDNQKRVEVE